MFSDLRGAENGVFSTVQNAADRCLMVVYMSLIHLTVILCRNRILVGSIAGNLPLLYKGSEQRISFQKMATRMALASANVQVPTTELLLHKLQYMKIVFSLEIMTFATFQTTSLKAVRLTILPSFIC